MLLRNEIDCIAADLTVTAQRMTVMDFTKPFMSSSITLLLKVSQVYESLRSCQVKIVISEDFNFEI